MNSDLLADKISSLALEKKGRQIAILNVKKLSNVTDFFVIVTADSQAQLRAIADHVDRQLRKDYQHHAYHKEGLDSPTWILLDYVDVVVHLFRQETREYYSFEKLWGDAEMKMVVDEKNGKNES